MQRFAKVIAGLAMCAFAGFASAQAWPSRPIKYIVPFAPAGTPPEIVRRLNTEIVKIINLPEVREKLVALGAEPAPNSPEAFGALVKSEVAKWADVVKKSGAKVD